MERWFRTLNDRTKRFYNNINAGRMKAIEELVSIMAHAYNLRIRQPSQEVVN